MTFKDLSIKDKFQVADEKPVYIKIENGAFDVQQSKVVRIPDALPVHRCHGEFIFYGKEN